MLQETIQTVSEPQTVEKAIKFGAIGMNIVIMGLAAFLAVGSFALKSIKTSVATTVWIKANYWRFTIGSFMILALAILLVVSPAISMALGDLGFNADQSPFAIGFAIGLLIVGATAEPSKNPEG